MNCDPTRLALLDVSLRSVPCRVDIDASAARALSGFVLSLAARRLRRGSRASAGLEAEGSVRDPAGQILFLLSSL